MPRLGEYLCKQQLLDAEKLEEALHHQVVYGARLGTNLVELGLMSVEQLAQCLSEFHATPLPPRDWLERPERSAVERVTRPMVERIRFIPMRLEGSLLHAAVLDPRSSTALDELRVATGCRIKPYVLPELWMHEWLLQLFQVPRGIRLVETGDPRASKRERPSGDGADRSDAPRAYAETAPASHDESEEPAGRGARGDGTPPDSVRPPPREAVPAEGLIAAVQQVASTTQLLHEPSDGSDRGGRPAEAPTPSSPPVLHAIDGGKSERRRAASQAPPTATSVEGAADDSTGEPAERSESQPPARPELLESEPPPERASSESGMPAAPTHRRLAELEQEMLEARDRDRLIALSLSIAARYAERVALFIVQQGMIQGVCAAGESEITQLEGVLVPLRAESMLADVARAGKSARVQPRLRTIDSRLVSLLGEENVPEAGVFPILIKTRVVNLLYADNADAMLATTSFGALCTLAEHIGHAYEQLIVRRKGGEL